MVYRRGEQREGTMESFYNVFHISDLQIQMQKLKCQSKGEWGKRFAVVVVGNRK